jgi:hypothetical protein
MSSPVCVLGEERCGTSYCAMLLHTRLGVHMGNEAVIGYDAPLRFVRPGCMGMWERTITTHALTTIKAGRQSNAFLVDVLRELECIYGDRRWGFKHPGFSLYIPLLATAFPFMRFVACTREPRDAAVSFLKMHHPDLADRDQMIELYTDKVEQQTRVCIEKLVDFAPNRWGMVDVSDYKNWGEDIVVRHLAEIVNVEMPNG